MRSNSMPLLCLVLLAPTAARCARPVDTAAEERVLRDLDKKWVQATLAKDTIAIGNVYAEDAEFLPPNQPAVSGRAGKRPRRVDDRLGQVRHRAEVVEYRIARDAANLGGRLEALRSAGCDASC